MSPGFGRAALAACLLGASPWAVGSGLQAWGEHQAHPARILRLRTLETTPAPRLSKIQRLPKGKAIILEAGRAERWRCLVEIKAGQDPQPLKRLKRLTQGAPAWIVQGLGPEASIPIADLGLARLPVTLEATGYDPGPVDNTRGWVGVTKSGERARFGIAAVDPRVIPLGTHLYIEGYGPALAADVGGAIKGHRIDLCFNSTREANAWGRKKARVWRIDPLHGAAKARWQALFSAP